MPAEFISAIVASTPEGVIGDQMQMPWRLSSDLKRFKRITMGGALLMGRRTFDSIGRVLPGRQTIVMTRNPQWQHSDVTVVNDWEAAIAGCQRNHLFIVGGGQIYEQAWPHCRQILWTRVWAMLRGDTSIEIPWNEFQMVSHQHATAGPADDYPTDFQRWRKLDCGGNR